MGKERRKLLDTVGYASILQVGKEGEQTYFIVARRENGHAFGVWARPTEETCVSLDELAERDARIVYRDSPREQ